MKKSVLAWIVAAAMVLALCGCGADNDEEEPEGPAATEQTEEETGAGTEEEETASSWTPDGPVTLIVPYEANSINDITVRVLTQYVERNIGQTIQIENIPGPITTTNEAGESVPVDGAGSLGWSELAARPADGMTLGFVDLPGFTDSLARQSGYYTSFDFTPICNHVSDTAVLVARENDERFADLAGLVAYGAEHPGELIAATDGERGNGHAWTQAFARSAGLSYGTKHCASAAEAVQSVLSGSADFCVAKEGDLYGRSKGLRLLGAFAGERLSGYPDVPTVGEAGYYDKWLGAGCCIMGPAGIPREAVAFYERAFEQAMTDSRYLAASSGITTHYMDAADTAAVIAQQRVFSLSKAAGLW